MTGFNTLSLCCVLLAFSTVCLAQLCYKKCGSGGTGITSRIVNGVEAPKCEWGWIVSLRIISNKTVANVNDPTQTDNICNRQNFINEQATRPWAGGVIVGDRWVLTSARGLYAGLPKGSNDILGSYVVVGGEYRISKSELLASGEPQEQIKFIESVHFQDLTYPIRVSTQNLDELAEKSLVLLKLKKPFTMNACVRTVCLPESAAPEDCVKKNCYIAGWGLDLSTNISPNTLRQAKFDFHSNDVCATINLYANKPPLKPGVRCASQIAKSAATCVGDQGGPLVCQDGTKGNEKWVLYGSVLLDTVCNGTAGPTLVSDIAAASSWITNTIK